MNFSREMRIKLCLILGLMFLANYGILAGGFEFEVLVFYLALANGVLYLLLFESLYTCYDIQLADDRFRVIYLLFRSRNREVDLAEVHDLRLEKARLKTSDTARTLVVAYHPDYAERITLPYLTPRTERALDAVFERFAELRDGPATGTHTRSGDRSASNP